MEQVVKEFLTTQRVGVLSISCPDTSIYSAALHFSFDENLPTFYFVTDRQSEKCKSLVDGSERSGALVIGTSEEDFKTFQARGMVKMIMEDMPSAWHNYLTKFPDRHKMRQSADFVILQFISTYWKYTDNKTQPRTHITSNGVTFP